MTTPDKTQSRQWQIEADRIAAFDEAAATSNDFAIQNSDAVDRDERIRAPEINEYAAPAFLRKTSTKEEFDSYCEILRELESVNLEYADESTREIEVYLAVTNQVRPVVDRIEQWCVSYFSRRLNCDNPRDHADAGAQYDRLTGEYNKLFGRLATTPRTLNYVFLHECTSFLQWFLLVRSDVAVADAFSLEGVPLRLQSIARGPGNGGELLVDRLGMWYDHLAKFLHLVHAAASPEVVKPLLGSMQPTEFLRAAAADIQEMRPFLVRNFDASATILRIPGTDGFVAWDWCTQFGIAHVFAGTSERDVLELIATRTTRAPVVIDAVGLLRDGKKPWVSSVNENRMPQVPCLGANVVVVNEFHQILYSFFDQIDLDRVRWHRKHQSVQETFDESTGEEVLALTCHELAEKDEELVDSQKRELPRRRIRSLRQRRLLTLLQDSFGCEVQQGKGSEVTVYRAGYVKFRLGRHSSNPEVPTVVVQRLLQKLGISLCEWFSLCND